LREHHTIVSPDTTPCWFDATLQERAALMTAMESAKAVIEKENRPDGYNIGFNCGPSAGQTIFNEQPMKGA
jgi:diadenosine tetraphosphate (Ap4A) HIT family hydrolase